MLISMSSNSMTTRRPHTSPGHDHNHWRRRRLICLETVLIGQFCLQALWKCALVQISWNLSKIIIDKYHNANEVCCLDDPVLTLKSRRQSQSKTYRHKLCSPKRAWSMFAEVSHTPAVFGEKDKVQAWSVASLSTVIKVQVKIKCEALMFYFWTVKVIKRHTQQGEWRAREPPLWIHSKNITRHPRHLVYRLNH